MLLQLTTGGSSSPSPRNDASVTISTGLLPVQKLDNALSFSERFGRSAIRHTTPKPSPCRKNVSISQWRREAQQTKVRPACGDCIGALPPRSLRPRAIAPQ